MRTGHPQGLWCLGHLAAAAFLLAGCSLAGVVGSDVSRYQTAAGESTDREILQNILWAKDQKPLHFEQLTQMHGSVTATGTVTLTVPFGNNSAGANGNSIAPGGTFTQNPTFDIGTLDDQSFWRGITTQPISPQAIQGLVRSNVISARMALLLFFSEIDIGSRPVVWPPAYAGEQKFDTGNAKSIINSSRSDQPRINNVHYYDGPTLPPDEDPNREWWSYLSYVNHSVGAPGTNFFIHPYQELIPQGSKLGAPGVKDVTSIDASKYVLERDANNKYTVYSIQDKYALCLYKDHRNHLLGFPNNATPSVDYGKITDDAICTSARVYGTSKAAQAHHYNVFRVRSVYSIIQYIGSVLRWQEEHQAKDEPDHRDKYITDRPVADPPNFKTILFRLSKEVQGTSRVGVEYEGRQYYISGDGPCDDTVPHREYCDASLGTLSVIEVLLNLNKTAQSIPQTPVVKAVP